MKKCTLIDNPLVSIVLAVYKPDYVWFGELLSSLNHQSYNNIELLIWDDCPNQPVDEEFIKKYITRFQYSLFRGQKNMGSNYAFERLTELSNGELISYCDQDDIWNENKVKVMVDAFKEKNADLVYCDLSVIDGNGKQTLDSFTKVSKRQVLIEGKNLFKYLIVRNVIVGCAMMVKSQYAKASIPFEKSFVHDHWIALFTSCDGYIYPIKKQLIKYRIHGSNQTGVLKGVETKQDYFQKRILSFMDCAESVYLRFKDKANVTEIVNCNYEWAKARVGYFKNFNFKDLATLIKYRDFNKSTALFEIGLPFMPNFVFKIIIDKIKKGKL